jgi:type VI secretion system secreted protein Hcp
MPASAFLKFDGVPGESTAKGFEEQIEIDSWSMNAHNNREMGTSGRRTTGSASMGPLSVQKKLDKASGLVLSKLLKSEVVPEAVLSITRQLDGAKETYYKVTLTNCFVKSYSIAGSGGDYDDASENLEIAYEKATWGYTGQDAKGAVGGEAEYEYSVVEGA